jgi:hypothetical protein
MRLPRVRLLRRDTLRWAAGAAIAALALFPLVGPETSASPREVLDLYYRYMQSFEYAKAFYLLTDNYKGNHLPAEARNNRWLFSPATPFGKAVWSTLEIDVAELGPEGADRAAFEVQLTDYVSGKRVRTTVTLVKVNRRWEIDEVRDSTPEDL